MNATNIKQTLLQWKDAALSIDLSKFKPTNRKTALIATAIFAGIVAVPTIAYFALRNRKVTNTKQEVSLDNLIFGKSTNLFKKLGVPFPDDLPRFEGNDLVNVKEAFSLYNWNGKDAILVKTEDQAFFLSINETFLLYAEITKDVIITPMPLISKEGEIINQELFETIKNTIIKIQPEHSE